MKFTDEKGNTWTLPELIEDLERGEYLYLTPKMCADLAVMLRQLPGASPSVVEAPFDKAADYLFPRG